MIVTCAAEIKTTSSFPLKCINPGVEESRGNITCFLLLMQLPWFRELFPGGKYHFSRIGMQEVVVS